MSVFVAQAYVVSQVKLDATLGFASGASMRNVTTACDARERAPSLHALNGGGIVVCCAGDSGTCEAFDASGTRRWSSAVPVSGPDATDWTLTDRSLVAIDTLGSNEFQALDLATGTVRSVVSKMLGDILATVATNLGEIVVCDSHTCIAKSHF